MVGPWSSHRRAAGLVMGLAMGLAMGLVMARAGNAADREGADEVEAGVEAEDSMDSHGVSLAEQIREATDGDRS
jgi:hypothetical protein